MAVPISPLYIDIPGKGTARVYFQVFGNQFDEISNVYEEIDYKPIGNTAFDTIDEADHATMLGGVIDSAPAYIRNILLASGVTGFPAGDRALVEWFLAKPKHEVDGIMAKWKVEKLFPAIAAWATKILASALGTVSTPTGTYRNVEEALNSVWASARVSIVNGEIKITSA